MEKANITAVHLPGKYLYVLKDAQLGGFITWMEKGESAILAFTTGDKAEQYANEVLKRKIDVYRIGSHEAKHLIAELLSVKIGYILLDIPPEHHNIYSETDIVRNYAIVDLKSAIRLFK